MLLGAFPLFTRKAWVRIKECEDTFKEQVHLQIWMRNGNFCQKTKSSTCWLWKEHILMRMCRCPAQFYFPCYIIFPFSWDLLLLFLTMALGEVSKVANRSARRQDGEVSTVNVARGCISGKWWVHYTSGNLYYGKTKKYVTSLIHKRIKLLLAPSPAPHRGKKKSSFPYVRMWKGGMSLLVQWLRLCVPNAGGPGLFPGQGTRYCMPQLRPSIAKKKKYLNIFKKNMERS